MLDDATSIPFGAAGAVAALITCLVSLIVAVRTGTLVSGKQYADTVTRLREQHTDIVDRLTREQGRVEQVMEQRVTAAERREELWRQAYLNEAQRGVVRDDQVGELLEVTRTMTKIWEGVQQMIAGEGRHERTQQRDRGGRPAAGR